ncbi:hypothetical protein RHMOL_Rhmol04G0161900 [Rhododendron molle]|uniref:Uncharacterized protein n=1 Tax=Rhododendron molle TaxID=49168 RepID=A0ACC0P2V9_RHOML|nr:hypothetical protein RHMOL_Rhmol04G0161900 [Rhododendron molle]
MTTLQWSKVASNGFSVHSLIDLLLDELHELNWLKSFIKSKAMELEFNCWAGWELPEVLLANPFPSSFYLDENVGLSHAKIWSHLL